MLTLEKKLLKGQCHKIFDHRFFFIKTSVLGPQYKFEFAKIFEFFKMHAVSLTPHAQTNFRTTLKNKNPMQNSDGMQNMTPHARSMNDSNGPGSF
jgi:hypothetical protein